jgi:hypothetical protein
VDRRRLLLGPVHGAGNRKPHGGSGGNRHQPRISLRRRLRRPGRRGQHGLGAIASHLATWATGLRPRERRRPAANVWLLRTARVSGDSPIARKLRSSAAASPTRPHIGTTERSQPQGAATESSWRKAADIRLRLRRLVSHDGTIAKKSTRAMPRLGHPRRATGPPSPTRRRTAPSTRDNKRCCARPQVPAGVGGAWY